MVKKIKLEMRLLPWLVWLTALMQLLDPGKVWTILLVTLGGAWLAAVVWVRALAGGLNLRREVRFGWAQVGDQLEERFTLTNSSHLPALWVEVLDQSNMPGYQVSRVTGVDARGRNQWRTRGVCNQRGLFTLGPTQIQASDPLGIYSLTLEHPARTTLMVVPPVVPLPAIEVSPGGRSGDAPPRANAPERTVSAAGVRQFTPGDSLRWIHWRTTARHGSPFVHIFDGTPAGDWWIVLDLDQQVQAGAGWDSTTEHGIVLAASLADRGLRNRLAVGLAANSKAITWLPPQSGNSQRQAILRALALADPGHIPLEHFLEKSRYNLGKRTSLVVITPSPSTDWIRALFILRRRGVVPTILLLDPGSFGGGQSSSAVLDLLKQMGIASYRITPELLDQPAARPGTAGRWEWRTLATGRALPLRKPRDLAWKTLR